MFCPIMVDISNKKVLIVGGGKIAYRKAKSFLKYQASVLVVSPQFIYRFYELKKKYRQQLTLIEDTYDPKYIDGSFLVVGATSSRKVNEQIALDSHRLNILCNIVDRKEESNFISPGVVDKDGLVISISTMGKFPYLTRKIKEDIEHRYSKFDKEYLDLLEKLREIVLLKYKEKSHELFDHCIDMNKYELKEFLMELKNENVYKGA
ncbi:MAG: bifunctional precorrin-2 dehydrogenase/sirohydrochlorin ferrochelatase [Tissierellia bacterium]|nr:bifunctional precorrin-2 dehydrogenase/sirohydrochlorin ferrochelatase [Tissierellia bacterium]